MCVYVFVCLWLCVHVYVVCVCVVCVHVLWGNALPQLHFLVYPVAAALPRLLTSELSSSVFAILATFLFCLSLSSCDLPVYLPALLPIC